MRRTASAWWSLNAWSGLTCAVLALAACAKERSYDDAQRDDAGREGQDDGAGDQEDGREEDLLDADVHDADHGPGIRDAGTRRSDAAVSRKDACVTSEQSSTDGLAVDLLFMIDNSGSMAQEQKKLAAVLPSFVSALTTGNRDGRISGSKPDFQPVESLHIGVVTSDMGVNGAPAPTSCGERSFIPTERGTRASTMLINKPLGDDGILQVDTAVAVDGVWIPIEGSDRALDVVQGDPACASVTFQPNYRFVDFTAGDDPTRAAERFSCIVKRGRNGCGLEQQLEAVLKSLTPPDSNIKFTAMSPNGHGNALKASSPPGFNQNFLREDAILAIVVVSDEEDCSIPDASRAIFDSTSMAVPGGINVRCGLKENAALLNPVSRYIDGLRALKPALLQERIIFAAAVGIPTGPSTGAEVHAGSDSLDKLLVRADMQFITRRNASNTDDEPVPTCFNESGDGSAAPGKRYLEVAKAFGDNGLVTSICEDQYGSLLSALIDKIAIRLEDPPTTCE